MSSGFSPTRPRPATFPAATASCKVYFGHVVSCCAVAALLAAGVARAQITINTKTGAVTNNSSGVTINTVDRRYQQITPTQVPLTKSELDPKTRLELIRLLESEQGFAMRPFPCGHKGLTLAANGKLEPAGEAYLDMVTSAGLSAKPGDRVVLTDVKIEHSRLIFELNGGPDPKHRFLRHILSDRPGLPLHGRIIPTPRNIPARNIYRDHGFAESKSGVWHWTPAGSR